MLSEDFQNLLARILFALAEGERNVEEARKEIANEDDYDIQKIFRVLDNNGDNFITPKDLQKYLFEHGLEVNFKEIKLLILFYDQDHDFALTYGEIFKIIHPGREFPRLPKYIKDKELNPRVDTKLYNLLEQEILLARNISALLDEIKHKNDFNIHSAFHALKYYACITGDSINMFLKNCGMDPTAGDIRAIVKRLDINKDEIIDFCEFHAFLGYPDCSFCCPCFPCPNCGIKYCEECLQDIPCYLFGCDHKGMDSKMRCTSVEHNPHIGQMNSFLNNSRGPNSLYNTRFFSSGQKFDEENEKNNINTNSKKNPYGINRGNNKYPGNLSPEQYNLLQGLTNPEQLNKFMAINNILDRQNGEEINLTKNLSLRLCPIRDFDPKDWGCKNCPCNIHSNPNVPCDCCTCNICPNKPNGNNNGINNKEKTKQRKFPKINLYSYTYTYEPEINNQNKDDVMNSLNNINNSPLGKNSRFNSPYYNKDTNKFRKTMANSSDEEKEYGRSKNNFYNNNGNNNNNNNQSPSPYNDMIYNDEMDNNNINNFYNNINENEGNIDIRNKFISNKTYKNEENNIINNKRRNYGSQNYNGQNDENNEGEREQNDINNYNNNGDNNNNRNLNKNNNDNFDNNYKTFSPNNENSGKNPFNRNNNNNQNIPDNIMYRTSPDNFNFGKENNNNNNKDPLVDSLGFKLTKTVKLDEENNDNNINNRNKNPKNSRKSPAEEESEEEFYTSKKNFLNKSRDEIIDIEEQKFLSYLKSLIKSEREIEFARRDLMRQKDFNGEDAFRLFEVQGTGVVTKGDLLFGLKLLGIKPTEKQLTLLFNIYDLDGNGVLNYSDFFDMVISYKDLDRKEEERRKANRNIENRNINIFSERTRELYKKLFLTIIEEEERMEELKQNLELNDDLIMGIFNRINVDKDWICDKYEFVNYCLRNKVCNEKKDAYLAFIKLNKKRDGGLDIKDISVGLKSSFFYGK